MQNCTLKSLAPDTRSDALIRLKDAATSSRLHCWTTLLRQSLNLYARLHSDMATASLSILSLLYVRSVTCQPEAASTTSTITDRTGGKIDSFTSQIVFKPSACCAVLQNSLKSLGEFTVTRHRHGRLQKRFNTAGKWFLVLNEKPKKMIKIQGLTRFSAKDKTKDQRTSLQ